MPACCHRVQLLTPALCLLLIPLGEAQTIASTPGSQESRKKSPHRLSISIRDLGVPDGWATSEAVAINNRGQIAGNVTAAGGVTFPFMWTPNGGFRIISAGGPAHAVDINDRGEVVGFYDTGGFERPGFLWSRQRGFVDLGPSFTPEAVNNKGQIAGYCYEFILEACVWDGGVITRLGRMDRTQSFATSINDRGDVAGYGSDEIGDQVAFLWTRETGAVLLPPEDNGGTDSAALGINNRGEVTGFVVTEGGFRGTVVWSKMGRRLRLGPDGVGGFAINDRGWVLGSGFSGYVLWLPSGVVKRLPSPHQFVSRASDLNNRGQIVGVSSSEDGTTVRAVLWKVRSFKRPKQ